MESLKNIERELVRDLDEREFVIIEGKVLTTLTYREVVLLVNYCLDRNLDEMVEIEEERQGIFKEIILYSLFNLLKTTLNKNGEIDLREKTICKTAISLYEKLSSIKASMVFCALRQIFESREEYVFELLDAFSEDVA